MKKGTKRKKKQSSESDSGAQGHRSNELIQVQQKEQGTHLVPHSRINLGANLRSDNFTMPPFHRQHDHYHRYHHRHYYQHHRLM
jgi:hypothetical protein